MIGCGSRPFAYHFTVLSRDQTENMNLHGCCTTIYHPPANPSMPSGSKQCCGSPFPREGMRRGAAFGQRGQGVHERITGKAWDDGGGIAWESHIPKGRICCFTLGAYQTTCRSSPCTRPITSRKNDPGQAAPHGLISTRRETANTIIGIVIDRRVQRSLLLL